MECFVGTMIVGTQDSMRTTSSAERAQERKASDARRKAEAEKLKKEGNDYFLKGQYVEAVGKYSGAARVYGTRPVIMCNLAAAYLKLNQYELAEWAADTALFHSPKMAKARFRRAMARKGRGMFKDLKVVVEHHPEITEATVELSRVKEERQLHGNGERAYETYDENFPPYDAEDWDPPLDSDSEEANHTSSGKPCKFHNHGGCRRGFRCGYSHAPDSNSVRDDLGQNVCLYFLLERCRYGDKCSYAHTKDNLARGWWSTSKGIKEARELRSAVVNDPVGKADLIARLENTTAYGQLEKVKRNLLDVDINCALLPELLERDSEGTRKGTKPGAPTTNHSTSSRGSVLIICLSNPELFNDINEHLLKTLERRINLLRAENATQALAYLDQSDLVGVIIGDEGITNRPNSKVVTRLVRYVKEGGAVVIGGLYPSFSDGDSFDRLFKQGFDLPWKRGSYFRTTFHKNTQNDLVNSNPSLPASYSMKALHLQKIPPESALYKANDSSFTQSLVFPATAVTDFDESPAVSVRFGSGIVSYLGDVNAEEESTKTILVMLGLPDSPLPKLPIIPGSEKGEASRPNMDPDNAGNGKKRKEKGKKAKDGVAAGPSTPLSKRFSPSQWASARPTAPREPFIMHLCLADSDAMAWSYRRSIAAIEIRTRVKKATTEAQAQDLLSSCFIAGVFVTDPELTDPKYNLLLDELVEYVDDGGRLVFGRAFSPLVQFHKLEELFKKFQLGWKASSYTSEPLRLSGNWKDKHAFLPKEIGINAVFLAGFDPDEAVCLPTYDASTSASQTPIAVSENGRGGLLGYIGDVNAEPCNTPSILAMFDLLKYPCPLERPLTNKFVIVLSCPETFDDFQNTPIFREMDAERVEVIYSAGYSHSRLADLLSSPNLQSVFLLDNLGLVSKYSWLMHKIVAYVWSGGCVILTDRICCLAPEAFNKFVMDNFYLPWKISSARKSPVTINSESRLWRKMPRLAEERGDIWSEGTFLSDVGVDEVVFGSEPGVGPERATHVSVAYAAVGNGHVAFFGNNEIREVDKNLMLGMMNL